MLRDALPYRDPEVDYEALVVKRNAPRWLAKLAEFGIPEPRDDGTMTVNWANSWLPTESGARRPVVYAYGSARNSLIAPAGQFHNRIEACRHPLDCSAWEQWP